jgi:hypothetical protein
MGNRFLPRRKHLANFIRISFAVGHMQIISSAYDGPAPKTTTGPAGAGSKTDSPIRKASRQRRGTSSETSSAHSKFSDVAHGKMPDIKFTVSILAGTNFRVGSSTGKEPAMYSAEFCRIQSEQCRRLVRLAQSEAEATVLRSLSRSWVMIANQSDRLAEITKNAPRSEKVGREGA